MNENLISPEYLELQKRMHEIHPTYGTSSNKWFDLGEHIFDRYKPKSVLDYGCGKGELKKKFGDIIREYDPAIEGKDAMPDVADLVVCTDVLEHIEPDKLDSVLDHIRGLARKAVIFNIHLKPAIKELPDGRNAHLIVEDAEWWKKRLGKFFQIDGAIEHESNTWFEALPYRQIGDIHSIGVMSDDDRFEHSRKNCALTDKRVKLIPPHDRVCILLCYGPSLQDTWEQAIGEFHTIGNADFVSVSGAHDFVIEKGIIPRYHVECDPRLHKGDMVKNLNQHVEYLMASCCHPEVVEKMKNCKLTLWHLDGGEPTKRIGRELEPNAMLIGGGGSVGLRAISLMVVLGYRRFIIHAMDCSYREDGATHAGIHTGKKVNKIEVISAGRKFVSSPVLLTYLRDFDKMRALIGDPEKDLDKIEIIMRGDGLLQHTLLTSGTAVTGEAYEAYRAA